MNTTKEQRKQQAVKYLKELNIYKPYIDGFMKEDNVCFYENFGGHWAYQEKDLYEKIKEIENKYNCTVYAVTHEYTDFGECYSLMLVTDYPEEWKNSLVKNKFTFYAFAYVWNKDDDWCSEFGTIGVKSFGGGLKRVA